MRMVFGMLMSLLIVEEMYVGPTDFTPTFCNFNWWGNVMTFLSLLFQFKTANYEIAKKLATNKSDFQYSLYYKKIALQTLQLSVAINFIVIAAYWAFIFSETETQFRAGSSDQAFGDNGWSLGYWYYRSIVIHTVPYFMTLICVFSSDVIFMETDWWLLVLIGILYTLFNYAACTYNRVNVIYYMDWSIISAISAYSPLFCTVGFTTVALAHHFFIVCMTQILNQRFVYNFKELNQNV